MKDYLKLSKELYKFEKVLSTIDAFSDYARIRMKDDLNYYILEFSESKYDLNITKAEFENYLIDESNGLG